MRAGRRIIPADLPREIITDRMVREREAGPETYELVRDAIALLEGGEAEPGVLRAFELPARRSPWQGRLGRLRRVGWTRRIQK